MLPAKFRNFLPVFTVTLLLIIPLAILTRRLSFRLDTDYNVVLPMAQFAINAFTQPQKFLTWNPYIGLGVPVLGDPSSLVFSPWYMPIFLLFGADMGVRVIIALTLIVSGFSMWVFLRSLDLDKKVVAWGAILYETSGALAAIVANGHIEKFASYAVTPFAFLLMWKPKMSAANRITLGLLLACMYLSDDFYTPWFLSIFLVSFTVYNGISKRWRLSEVALNFLTIYGSFIIFSLPKLIPFVRDVLPYFDRQQYIDPFMGSIHAFLLPLPYIVPWQVSFYDRPTLQRILDFRFNWYEYYAFITPIAFILLVKIQGVLKKIQVKWAFVALLVGASYISLKYPYSPFYWIFHLFPFIQTFRVPQRVVVPLLVPVIALLSYCADYWIREKKSKHTGLSIILITSVMWTSVVTFQTMKAAFVPLRVDERYIAQELRRRDAGNFYVANFACCMQPDLLTVSIPVLNYYYGWTPSYAPRFTNKEGDQFDFNKLSMVRPSYIIANKKYFFNHYGYSLFFEKGDIQVWKTESPTIFPSL